MDIETSLNEALTANGEWSDLKFAGECRELSKNGVSETDGVAFHGTTVTAILHMAQSGVLPTGLQDGCIYFFPRPSMIHIEHPKCVLPESDIDAYDGCISYAEIIAAECLMLEVLGRGFDSRKIWSEFLFHVLSEEGEYDIHDNLRNDYYPDEVKAVAENIGVEKLQVVGRRIISQTGGVILALSENVLRDFPIEEAPPEDDGMRVVCPKGIAINYFTGLLALGDYEEAVLERFGIL